MPKSAKPKSPKRCSPGRRRSRSGKCVKPMPAHLKAWVNATKKAEKSGQTSLKYKGKTYKAKPVTFWKLSKSK